jgi:hypothetical protein
VPGQHGPDLSNLAPPAGQKRTPPDARQASRANAATAQRAGLTRQQFLSHHAEVMLCADLFTKEVWTLSGLKTACIGQVPLKP